MRRWIVEGQDETMCVLLKGTKRFSLMLLFRKTENSSQFYFRKTVRLYF